MLKRNSTIIRFALILSILNFVLFHIPFFKFVFSHVEYKEFTGWTIITSLVILMVVANAFTFYLLLYLFKFVGKLLLGLFFLVNSICIYFVVTYGVIIDESMIGNVLNTKYEEASSFFSVRLLLFILFLGVIPCIYIFKTKVIKTTLKKFLIRSAIALLFMLVMVFVNASNWLWIDKNSKQLGGLAMPWSYSVNIPLFYIHKAQRNRKEILLPKATVKDSIKTVVVLVIGESARRENFSLYGYKKNTNPLLSTVNHLYCYPAQSAATYTTAGVKSILEYKNSNKLYEILPNYLYRNNVDVIWRTTNWGEPPVHIKTYQKRADLMAGCKGVGCKFDGILLSGLKQQILASKKNKIFIVLHTSTSHGPNYSKKYPPRFETFKPVCNSVELGDCSHEALVNAYDNTIVYTDYILYSVIKDLKDLKQYKSAMIFVSDHGESLGEKNLYMHGLPKSFAPKEQYEIPFIVWDSDSSMQFKPYKMVTQSYVFHSVLKFLNIQSPIYNEKLNVFK